MATCASCQQPLVLQIVASDDEEDVEMGGASSAVAAAKVVPDDVHLTCGCHFHWQCLLDAYNVGECPSCSSSLITSSHSGGQQILCTLNNEGGLQEDLDIFPLLTEESYLKAFPEERKCRAFLEFCREGDVEAIVGMLQDDDEDDEDHLREGVHIDTLRYQDSLGDMQSGLHAAVVGGSRETAWLLLFLASQLSLHQFPAEVLHEAQALGINRPAQDGKIDIRSLRDSQGRSAEQLATELGGVWIEWLGTGRLAV